MRKPDRSWAVPMGIRGKMRRCTSSEVQNVPTVKEESCGAFCGVKCRVIISSSCVIWSHLTKRCAFSQMPRVLPIGQMRCPFGQMRKLIKCGLQQHTWNWKVSNSNIKSWTQNRRQNTHPANNIVSCHRYASYHLHHQFNLYRPTV